MSTTLDINGNQYSNEHFNNYYGYQCCTSVKHEVNLTSNCTDIGTTVDIPQLDTNAHILVMHLYNNNALMNLSNVSAIEILFKRNDNTVVLGDWRNINITNPYRGTVEYLLSKEETYSVGLNTLQVNVKQGSGIMSFSACYNVVSTIQTSNSTTVILPDAPVNPEYPYGPHCHNCCCCNCPSPSGVPTTLDEMYNLFIKHTQDINLHTDLYKNVNIDNAFITLATYDEMTSMLDLNANLPNGKLFKINDVDGEIKYYSFDSSTKEFKEFSFGSSSADSDILERLTKVETNIVKVQEDLVSANEKINTNTLNITNNTNNITTNTNSINTISENTKTNTSNIETINSNIDTINTDILNANKTISKNTTDIDTNKSAIESNTEIINSSTTTINELKETVKTLQSTVTSLQEEINTLKTNQTSLQSVINTKSSVVPITQSDYDNLETKDANTMYVITSE